MRLERLALLACFAAGSGADARAQVLPLGGEFQVNLHTVADQGRPSLDVDADGDFVVVWQSYGEDGHYYGVFARRFDSAGVPNGLVFQVNAFTAGWQSNAKVALDSSGDFVVAWLSFLGAGTSDVFARRFSAAGVAQAAEFRVNTFTAGHQIQQALISTPTATSSLPGRVRTRTARRPASSRDVSTRLASLRRASSRPTRM